MRSGDDNRGGGAEATLIPNPSQPVEISNPSQPREEYEEEIGEEEDDEEHGGEEEEVIQHNPLHVVD